MDNQLKLIREQAAAKYSKIKIEHKSKGSNILSSIKKVNYLFVKNESYYVHIDGKIIKLEDECKLKLYTEPRSLSEFGKSFDEAYIKTVEGNVLKVDQKTYLLPFTEINYYKD